MHDAGNCGQLFELLGRNGRQRWHIEFAAFGFSNHR
jgi:hypothetical protein